VSAGGWRNVSSVTGVWYGAHVYEAPGERFAVLLCLGAGPVIGLGRERRPVQVESYGAAVALVDSFTRACGRWRCTGGGE
jgi:hypothetical protein